MPDTGHVIALVNLLKKAGIEYKLMVASGFDRGRCANEELQRSYANGEMTEDEMNAGSVWLDFLDSLHEAQLYDDDQNKLEE